MSDHLTSHPGRVVVVDIHRDSQVDLESHETHTYSEETLGQEESPGAQAHCVDQNPKQDKRVKSSKSYHLGQNQIVWYLIWLESL